MLPINVINGPQFDYIQKGNPTIDVNPRTLYATWLNLLSGELFICIQNLTGDNRWQGQSGTYIGSRYFSAPRQEIYNSCAIGTSVMGIAFDGENILAVNDGTNDIEKYNKETGALLDSFATGFLYPYGVAWDGEHVLCSDGGSGGTIKVFDGFSSSVLWSITSDSSVSYMDITIDGSGNLIGYGNTGDIYVHDGLSNDHSLAFSLSGIGGISSMNGNMLGRKTGAIVVYDGFSDVIDYEIAVSDTVNGMCFDTEDVRLYHNTSDDFLRSHIRTDEI